MGADKLSSFDKKELQSVLDGIEESIVVLDDEYRIVCMNTAFCGWLKHKKKRILGEYCFSVIKDQPVRCNPCIVRESFRTGQYFETFHSHDLRGGKKVYHETKSYPIKTGDETKFVIYMFKDITERALIEEKVRELNKFKKKILDNAGIAINILDPDGMIMSTNMWGEKLFGWAEEDITGKSHGIFYREEDELYPQEHLEKALENGKHECEMNLVKNDKSLFPANLSISVIEDDDGEPIAFIEIINDMTKLKKAEQIIKKQLTKLKELDAIKEEYFYSTSHELKTPLTTIVSLTKMLMAEKAGKINDKQKEILDLIYCDSKRLRGAIQRILDISKIEAGKMVYHVQETDVSPLLIDIMSTLKILVDSKQITVKKKIPKDIPMVFVDPERVHLVLDNIINNAIKFTPQKGKIRIIASSLKDEVLVEISDSGEGIPQSDLKKVFEKYYQVKSGPGENVGGSGLGLVICKNIIEALGGRIWCESEIGKGTSFKFTLPTVNVEGKPED